MDVFFPIQIAVCFSNYKAMLDLIVHIVCITTRLWFITAHNYQWKLGAYFTNN